MSGNIGEQPIYGMVLRHLSAMIECSLSLIWDSPATIHNSYQEIRKHLAALKAN